MIQLPESFVAELAPYVVASQREDYLYITAWTYDTNQNAQNGNAQQATSVSYIVYIPGPMIFVPQSSLKSLGNLTLEVSNWSGVNTFEFEIDPASSCPWREPSRATF